MPTEPSSQESTDVQQTMDDDKEKQVDVIEAVASPEPQQHQYPDGGLRAWLTVLGAFLSQTTTIGQVDILVAKHPNITFTFTLCGQVYKLFWSISRSDFVCQSSTGDLSNISNKCLDYYVRIYLNNHSSSEIGKCAGVSDHVDGNIYWKSIRPWIFPSPHDRRHHIAWLGVVPVVAFAPKPLLPSLPDSGSSGWYWLWNHVPSFSRHRLSLLPQTTCPCNGYRGRWGGLSISVFLCDQRLTLTSCGAILHPIMLNQLFNGSVGFHNGVRASAGMNLGLLLLANLLMKPRLPPKKGGMSFPVNEFLRDPPYVFAMISGAVCMMAIFFPIFFLQLYVIQHDMDRQFAFYSISILNAASFLGRILPGFFVHYTGVFNQMIIHTAVIIAVMFCLLAVSNVAGVVCFAIFFGFFSGAAITLTPPMIATLARDFSDIGARLGLCFTVAGFAGLISAPVAGALLTGEYIWWRAILFAGLLLTLGELLMIAARVFVVRRTGSQKV